MSQSGKKKEKVCKELRKTQWCAYKETVGNNTNPTGIGDKNVQLMLNMALQAMKENKGKSHA